MTTATDEEATKAAAKMVVDILTDKLRDVAAERAAELCRSAVLHYGGADGDAARFIVDGIALMLGALLHDGDEPVSVSDLYDTGIKKLTEKIEDRLEQALAERKARKTE